MPDRWDTGAGQTHSYGDGCDAAHGHCERCLASGAPLTFFEHDVMWLCASCYKRQTKGTEWEVNA